jgi:nitroreductase
MNLKQKAKYFSVFWFFYSQRLKSWSDEKVKSQILKRGHLLEKAIREKKDRRALNKELTILFDELSKRVIPINESLRWAHEILFNSRFNFSLESDKDDRFSSGDQGAIENLIISRRSIRNWNNKNLKTTDIIKIIEIAKWAPNSCNRQGWFFLIINNRRDFKMVEKLTNQNFFMKAKCLIVVMTSKSKYSPSEEIYSYLDAGAITENILLLLHAKNLGACWLGLKESANYKKYLNVFLRHFELSDDYNPVSFLAVGNYDRKPKPPLRVSGRDLYKIIK